MSKARKSVTPLSPSSSVVIHNPTPTRGTRILMGTPTLGLVRIEWHSAVRSMVTPPNWSLASAAPTNWDVPTAQNILAGMVLEGGHSALWLLEDDNVPPADCLLRLDTWLERMQPKQGRKRESGFPIVSGLYYLKGSFAPDLGPEPLMYRGGGTRAYLDWTPGDAVMVDGVPTGCLLIHRRILEAYAHEPDMEWLRLPGVSHPVPKIFSNPSAVITQPDGGQVATSGTSDLYFSGEVRRRKLLAKAGWPELQQERYPLVVDTSLRVGHVDRETGTIYPQVWPTSRPKRWRRRL